MRPIFIFDGLQRYLLVRDGPELVHSERRVSPTRARQVLEAALRRQDPRLIRELAALFHLRGLSRAQVAARLLERLERSGTLGRDLVLVREAQGALPKLDPPARLDPDPPEPEPPEPIFDDDPDEDLPEARTTIRVSLFFDGTANNRANTRARETNSAAYRDNRDEGSFQNDYTNVSRLETLLIGDEGFEHSFSIYVEGIGTTDGEGDSLWGMATGMGGTGVKAKVEAGVNELLRGIRELGIARGVTIERIHLDAFGFSRGGAAARYFVHFILRKNPLQGRIEAIGYPVEQLEVNFVGLFDTVASYGLKHSNDTSDLELDAVRAAKKVVQLAAAEEHRKNFRLTDIASAVGAGVGIELYLPGVHSDIGGGYTNPYDEVGLEILDFDVLFSTRALERRFERERQWLIEAGWYRPAEIAPVNWWNELKVTKRGIRNHYTLIPLEHMANFATETGLSFEPVTEHHPIPEDLNEVRDIVAEHVAAHVAGTARSTAEHWINMRGELFQRLRHDYLHFSAFYGSTLGANAPQWSSGGARNGRRQRVVQAG